MIKFEALSVFRLLGLGLAVLLCAPTGLPKAAGVADTMIPHRAVYELELASPRGDGGVVDLDGRMEFVWNDVCDGWAVTQKARFIIGRADGLDVVLGSTVSSWESKDGLRYRFFIKREQNGRETENLRGIASLKAPGGPGTARFTAPEESTADLPKGTLFPTAHSLAILERMIAGDATPMWAVQFDGTGEDEGLSGVSVSMLAKVPEGDASALETPLLEDEPSWRISMAFFGMGQGEAEPNQEQRLRLYRNGVVDNFLIDYGSFAFNATLIELEPFPDAGC